VFYAILILVAPMIGVQLYVIWFVSDVALSLMVLSSETTKTQEKRLCYLVLSGAPLDLIYHCLIYVCS
jgi:hypothetical protein